MVGSTPPGELRFESLSAGTDIWGATQSNFLVALPGRHAKEAAILLNDPAAKLLAEAAGAENTEEFRAEAARVAGEVILRVRMESGWPIESIISVSRKFLEDEPEIAEQIKVALAK